MVFSLGGYDYFVKDLMKRKTKPYHMSNAELARQYYERFKFDHPSASLHCYDTSQYICLDNRARKNLIKQLQIQQKRQEEALQKTVSLIAEVESGIQTPSEPEPEEPQEEPRIVAIQEPQKPQEVPGPYRVIVSEAPTKPEAPIRVIIKGAAD